MINKNELNYLINRMKKETGGTGSLGGDTQISFTEASSRQNLVSGEKLSVLFGKIKKFFSDLKTVAFSGSYQDLTNKPSIPQAVSELSNDKKYQTAEQVAAAMAGQISSLGNLSGYNMEKVTALPAAPDANTFYIITGGD